MKSLMLLIDCVEGCKTLETGSIPLTVTSPPYDEVRNFSDWNFQALAKELWRVTAVGGVVCWVVADGIVNGGESLTSCRQKLFFASLGFRCYQTLVIARNGLCMPSCRRYGRPPEYVFVLSKGRPNTVHLIADRPNKTFLAGQRESLKGYTPRFKDGTFRAPTSRPPRRPFGTRSSVWTYTMGYHHTSTSKEAYKHPALMGEALARDLILSYSRPGEVVLDPFGGAGTTAVQALRQGRRYVYLEIEAKFLEIAKRRIRRTVAKL